MKKIQPNQKMFTLYYYGCASSVDTLSIVQMRTRMLLGQRKTKTISVAALMV